MPRLPAPPFGLCTKSHCFKQPDRLAPLLLSTIHSPHTECLSPLHTTHTYSMAGRALPSHLKPSAAEGGEGGFAPRHHGKTQSHVVSHSPFLQLPSTCLLFPACLGSCVRKLCPMNVLQSQWRFLSNWVCRAGALNPVQAGAVQLQNSASENRCLSESLSCSKTLFFILILGDLLPRWPW